MSSSSSITSSSSLFKPQFQKPKNHQQQPRQFLPKNRIQATPSSAHQQIKRRAAITRILGATVASTALIQGLQFYVSPSEALAEKWGTRSFLKEKFFEPGLSPEDAAARIRQTAEGLHSLREMLETMSWRYVMFYIRLKQSYLSQDMKNALETVPQGRRKAYISAANDLVDNMAEFDYYVRTPKVYESYLYYEKTLKSIDDLVAFLPTSDGANQVQYVYTE